MAKKAITPTAKPSSFQKMRKLIAVTLLLVLSFVAPQSNADLNMFPVTVADKAFFEQIRKAVLADDVEWFSEALFHHPFVLRLGKGKIILKNKNDLKKHAALVFNAHFKATVRNQSPDSLFKNWQGVMIGNGDIWFSEVGEQTGTGIVWAYRIIAINLPKVQSTKTEMDAQPTNPSAGKSKPN